MATARWITRAAAVGLLAAVLAGCGSDDGSEVERGASPTSDAGQDTGATTTDLLPPGTELADGLVVPDGAKLAGDVFRRPGYRFAATPLPPVEEVPETITPPDVGDPTTTTATTGTTTPPLEPDPGREEWTALLVVDGDPFSAWDDLAAQVREMGPAIAGSADACLWQVVRPPDDPTPPGPYPVVAGAPAEPIDHLRCEASASDGTRHVTLALRTGGEHPGSLTVEVVPDDSGRPSSFAEAAGVAAVPPGDGGSVATAPIDPEPVVPDDGPGTTSSTTSTTQQPPDTFPVPGPDPVGAEARDLLPTPPEAEDPAPGDPFGGEGNCFVSGYTRFPLPDGARLSATVGGPDGASVLVVDDVDAAIEALEDAAFAGDDAFTPTGPRDLPLADGTTARGSDVSIDGGGGGCSFLGSPDGRHLMITMHSD